ncbi:MAG TPA: type 4a pilus biogenesis protein PilO [Gemmatimonadaceae bacterium]|nr:type 4a pilus biogenesis protein PilO [Gemmatimonadaceae bacterium]
MPGMPKGQREQSLVLVCVLAIAAIGLYWYMVYSPRSAALEKQQDHIETLVTMNQRAKSEMSKGNLSELRAQLATYQQNLSLIRTLVPAGNEVPALLEQVSTAARRAGLDLASVDPQPVQEGSNYDTYRYGIAIVGGYHQLAEFFANVGSLQRIVLPVNVQLTLSTNANAKASHSAPGQAVIEAHFQLQTFVTHNPAEDADDQPPAKKGAKS